LAVYVSDGTFDGDGGYVFAASRARPMPSNRYGDRRTAAFEAEKYYNPWSIEHNLEVGGLIYQRNDGSFGFTGPNSGPKHEHHVFPFSLVDAELLRLLPKGAKPVGDYHTHGDDWTSEPFTKSDDEKFSPADMDNSRAAAGLLPNAIQGWPGYQPWVSYLGTPKGHFKEFAPAKGKTIDWGRYVELRP
jgi:hypothetical protein